MKSFLLWPVFLFSARFRIALCEGLARKTKGSISQCLGFRDLGVTCIRNPYKIVGYEP